MYFLFLLLQKQNKNFFKLLDAMVERPPPRPLTDEFGLEILNSPREMIVHSPTSSTTMTTTMTTTTDHPSFHSTTSYAHITPSAENVVPIVTQSLPTVHPAFEIFFEFDLLVVIGESWFVYAYFVKKVLKVVDLLSGRFRYSFFLLSFLLLDKNIYYAMTFSFE